MILWQAFKTPLFPWCRILSYNAHVIWKGLLQIVLISDYCTYILYNSNYILFLCLYLVKIALIFLSRIFYKLYLHQNIFTSFYLILLGIWHVSMNKEEPTYTQICRSFNSNRFRKLWLPQGQTSSLNFNTNFLHG